MGEKLRDLATGKVLGETISIELNHPSFEGEDYQVHIQSNKFRFGLDKNTFIKYSLSILLAEKNLKKLKGLKWILYREYSC